VPEPTDETLARPGTSVARTRLPRTTALTTGRWVDRTTAAATTRVPATRQDRDGKLRCSCYGHPRGLGPGGVCLPDHLSTLRGRGVGGGVDRSRNRRKRRAARHDDRARARSSGCIATEESSCVPAIDAVRSLRTLRPLRRRRRSSAPRTRFVRCARRSAPSTARG